MPKTLFHDAVVKILGLLGLPVQLVKVVGNQIHLESVMWGHSLISLVQVGAKPPQICHDEMTPDHSLWEFAVLSQLVLVVVVVVLVQYVA